MVLERTGHFGGEKSGFLWSGGLFEELLVAVLRLDIEEISVQLEILDDLVEDGADGEAVAS